MSRRRKRQFRFATFTFLPVVLLLALMATLFLSSAPVSATNTSDLAIVKQYVAAYISGQYGAGGNEGEDGFIMTAATLNTRINSNGDTSILGEGDDVSTAPILNDNLGTQGTWIPGTATRCQWNAGTGLTGASINCFDSAAMVTIKAKVDAHAAAGFSTDIVDYCVSGHTEASATGAFGYIAQTGGLASDGSIPKVYALKFGRNGWTNNVSATFSNTNPLAAADAAGVNTPPTSVAAASACNSSVSNFELLRCQAQWAIYNGTVGGMTGGNVGNGILQSGINTAIDSWQTVDVRTGSPSTVSAAGSNIQVPINTLFAAGLTSVDPTPNTVIVSRTPMVGGIVAEGMKMLGYNLPVITGTQGGFINGGVRGWNNTVGEAPVSDGLTRVGLGSTAIDSTPPSVSGISAGTITATSAIITRTTSDEPATMKVEYGTSPGVYPNTANSTVLNQTNKTVGLSGLTANTHYYYRVTSYDGQANGTESAEQSFWTDVTAPTITNVSPADGSTIYTDSTTVTADLADNLGGSGIDTDPGVTMVHVDSAMIMTGCTITSSSVSCPTTSLGPLAYGGPHTLEIFTADLAGNPASSTTMFNVGDNVAPAVSYTLPTGTINNTSPTITGTVTDPSPSSGLPSTGTLSLSTDGGISWLPTTYTCTITGSDVSCPVTSTLTGDPATTYTAKIEVSDNDANTGSDTGSFTVDTAAPTVTANPIGYQPGNWTNDTTPLLSAAITGVPDGQHIIEAGVTIDSVACDGTVNYSDTSVDCTPVTPLTEGAHAISYSAAYSAGHPGINSQTVNIDLTAPVISNLTPGAEIHTSDPTLGADLSDVSGSGVNAGASEIYLDGSSTPLTGCTKTVSHISCTTHVDVGDHTFSVYAEDNATNSDTNATGSFALHQISYFWTWYDNLGGDNWVLLANPASNISSASYALTIGGNPMDLSGYNGGVVAPNGNITPRYDLWGGPVKATATNGVSSVLSQRILWPKGGGNSLEEVLATPESELSDHYYWTWYDQLSAGFTNWILIANPSATETVHATISFINQTDGLPVTAGSDILPGDNWNPQFPDKIGGPVEVKAYLATSDWATDPRNVIASQRVLTNSGTAFNEVPGIPATSLDSHYCWTWYDGPGSGNRDWILIANPNASDIYYEIKIAGDVVDTGGPIAPGANLTPRFPTGFGGMVEVSTFSDAGLTTPAPSISSQRILWGPSFEEVPGYSYAALAGDYHWTWYDQQGAGVSNWILIANPSATETVHAVISFTNQADGTPVTAELDIAPGLNWTPTFAGKMGGPVEVKAYLAGGAWPADVRDVMASQRVLWHGYFNEVLGTVLS